MFGKYNGYVNSSAEVWLYLRGCLQPSTAYFDKKGKVSNQSVMFRAVETENIVIESGSLFK